MEVDVAVSCSDRPRRILVLSKRRYMSKDLIADRYGRFREIPLALSRLGYEVRGLCLGYRSEPPAKIIDEARGGRVCWEAVTLGRTVLPGLAAYLRRSWTLAATFRPDIVLAVSDAPHAIWGVQLARRARAGAVVDLYDNFESYAGMAIPGIRPAFRHAVRTADLVACISPPLRWLVKTRYGRKGATMVLGNGVRRDLFHPRDRVSSRAALGLPEDVRLVGTAGALARGRDIETLFRAVDLLAARDPHVHLAVAGPRDTGLAWPKVATVHDLGLLGHACVPDLLNALDVVVVTNLDSTFGAYCHPQKACEAAACGTPVIVAATGALSGSANLGRGLYRVGSPESLADAVATALEAPIGVPGTSAPIDVEDWDEVAVRLAARLPGPVA